MRRVLCAFLIVLLMASISQAATKVYLSWKPSPEVDLAGYRFFLVNRINALDIRMLGQVDCTQLRNKFTVTLSFMIPGGGKYVIVGSVIDSAGNESARSLPAINVVTGRVAVFSNKSAPSKLLELELIPQ